MLEINSDVGSSLPKYCLQIQNHSYPFRHEFINKAFEIEVCEYFQFEEGTNQQIRTFLKIYKDQTKDILMSILGVSQTDKYIKINYEYAENSLNDYVKCHVRDKIQLRMEKLLMETRELAYYFVTKRMNILDALSMDNIGVKKSTSQHLMPSIAGSNKLIMPEFKIFISFGKCKLIRGEEQIGRMVLKVDQCINAMRKSIDKLIEQSLEEENSKQALRTNYSCGILRPQQSVQPFNDDESRELIFTKKKKRKKLANQSHILNEKSPSIVLNKSLNYSTPAFQCESLTTQEIEHPRIPIDLSVTVDKIIEKSRKNLQMFKKKCNQSNTVFAARTK